MEDFARVDLPSLSIVIPSYKGRDHLERCLSAVGRYAPPGTQVIVVDDGSTDDTPAWLRSAYPWIEVLALPSNRGFCAAVNAGIAQARGEVIELLNNDTEVRPGWAEAALQHFSDPTVGSVAPLVLRMDCSEIIDSAGQDYHVCGWAQNRGFGQTVSDEYQTVREVFGPSASAGFYRRAAFERAGGLLPEYGAYYEDVDLSFRLRWAGYRCIYEPASRVLHRVSASYGRQAARVVRLISRNEELVYWINLPWRQLALSFFPHLGFVAIRTARKAWSGELAPFLAGKCEALSRWRWILRRRRALRSLVQERREGVRLSVSRSPSVLWQGWVWMKKRKIASL